MTLVALARAAMVLPRGDNAESLGLIGGEAAHPLVQNGGDHHVIVAVLLQVLLRELLQRLNGGYVLNEVAALAVAHGDVLDALFGGQKGLDDGHGVGDAGGTRVPVRDRRAPG